MTAEGPPTLYRVGRVLVVLAAGLEWLPFAALTSLSFLAFLSSPGLPERD